MRLLHTYFDALSPYNFARIYVLASETEAVPVGTALARPRPYPTIYANPGGSGRGRAKAVPTGVARMLSIWAGLRSIRLFLFGLV
jgi:hypothetical protein